MNYTFCPECRNEVSYKITERPAIQQLKGKDYSFIEKIATCNSCGSELFIDSLSEDNLRRLYSEFRKANGIISLEKIREIPARYKIGKRPLSLLLGWGENTFSRYFDGDLPSRQYSDILLRLYDDPSYYIQLLETRKDQLNSISTYEKSIKAANTFLSGTSTKIDAAAAYLLSECEDITQLALQKMLYYVQAFYRTFYNRFFFSDDCEAWIHGPVYPKIYRKYSGYNFAEHKPEKEEYDFTHEEKAILDSVVSSFSCYSGKILERFTHSEMPWIITRTGLEGDEIENRIIEKSIIADYFENVKSKYKMLHPGDISDYAKDMFVKMSIQ